MRGFKLAKPSFASLISAHESAFTVYFTIVVVVVVVVAVCRRRRLFVMGADSARCDHDDGFHVFRRSEATVLVACRRRALTRAPRTPGDDDDGSIMASGCARRKRKRDAERRAAWERGDDVDVDGGDDARAKAAAAAALKRREDAVRALDASTASKSGEDYSTLANAGRILVRVRRDSPHVVHVLATSTSYDDASVFLCAVPKTWGRQGVEYVTRALGFDVIDYDDITLSKAPEVAACVVRLEDDGDVGSSAKKRKKKAADATLSERFLARVREMDEPIQAPPSSSMSVNVDGEGLNAWVASHRQKRPGTAAAVKANIDAWFERKQAEDDERAEEEARAAKTEDGWTKVQAKRGRRKTKDETTGTTVGGIRAATADARRKGPKKIANEEFYRFQSKEKKRNEIIELQAKFELDKQRIARLKAARKFKPT